MLIAGSVFAAGNTTNDSFNKAKRYLEKDIYYDHRVTFYCQAEFDAKKNVTLPDGFMTEKHTHTHQVHQNLTKTESYILNLTGKNSKLNFPKIIYQ